MACTLLRVRPGYRYLMWNIYVWKHLYSWFCLQYTMALPGIYIYNFSFLIPITLPIWIMFPNTPFFLRVILECWFWPHVNSQSCIFLWIWGPDRTHPRVPVPCSWEWSEEGNWKLLEIFISITITSYISLNPEVEPKSEIKVRWTHSIEVVLLGFIFGKYAWLSLCLYLEHGMVRVPVLVCFICSIIGYPEHCSRFICLSSP